MISDGFENFAVYKIFAQKSTTLTLNCYNTKQAPACLDVLRSFGEPGPVY